MERNANYALVGLISTILLIGLVVFFVWLGGSKLTKEVAQYDIVFVGPVHGVATGGEVDFNGIKVGTVAKITLDPANAQLVIARVHITPDVPVRKDSYATLEPQGITGVNYIQITAGSPSQPLLMDVTPDDQVPRLSSRRDALADLLANGSTVVQSAMATLTQLNSVMSDKNVAHLSGILSDTHAVTAELRAHKSLVGDAQKLLQDADLAVRQVDQLAHSSDTLVSGDARTSLHKLDAALDEMRAATHDVRVDLQKLQGPTQSFAETGLPQLATAIETLEATAEHLNRVLNEVQANPRALIGKAPAKEVDVRP
jgi:phospholipid/cholesterol/gamma-HCH transport system substrate-binding protein